jgi:hypothetical protein
MLPLLVSIGGRRTIGRFSASVNFGGPCLIDGVATSMLAFASLRDVAAEADTVVGVVNAETPGKYLN